MAEGISKVEYYSVELADKPGAGAHIMSAFKEAGVNFTGLWGYPLSRGKSKLDLVAENSADFKKAAKKLKIEVGAKQIGFWVSGKDKKGAVADVLQKLADAGVNVRAAQAICSGAGRFGALIQVDTDDVKKAAKALA
jgi:hypothetical protein